MTQCKSRVWVNQLPSRWACMQAFSSNIPMPKMYISCVWFYHIEDVRRSSPAHNVLWRRQLVSSTQLICLNQLFWFINDKIAAVSTLYTKLRSFSRSSRGIPYSSMQVSLTTPSALYCCVASYFSSIEDRLTTPIDSHLRPQFHLSVDYRAGPRPQKRVALLVSCTEASSRISKRETSRSGDFESSVPVGNGMNWLAFPSLSNLAWAWILRR